MEEGCLSLPGIHERSKSAAEKIQRRYHSKIFSGNVCGGNCKKADDTGEYSENQFIKGKSCFKENVKGGLF